MATLIKRYVFPLFTLAVLAVTVLVLRGELERYPPHEILAELTRLSPLRLALAALLTLGCYWIMTGYDLLAFLYVKQEISYARVTFAAFLAFAFGNNIGLANFAGMAVRLRVYSKWKIAAITVAEVVALDTLANWLGFCLAPGIVFALSPPVVPKRLHLPFHDVRPLGFLFLAIVASYLVVSFTRKSPVKIGKWRLMLPHSRIFLLQVLVACGDLTLGGLVLHLLLPSVPALTFWAFLGIFLLAQTIGLISHVPGALGVFETVMLVCLADLLPGPRILGALIAYRAIYYFFPLAVAAPLLIGFELRHRQTA